jgi:hypothetical protein
LRYRDHILLLFLLLMPALTAFKAAAQNPVKAQENMIRALTAGDGEAIGDCFNDLVDLDIPGYKGTYSRAQAGRMVRDFFGQHSVAGFRIVRQGTLGEKEHYTMAELRSGQKTWKVYFVLKDKEGKGVVPLFHINE